MKEIFNKIVDSFHNETAGFSARKLTAFVFVIFAGYIHWKYLSFDNCINALMIDAGVTLVALGIITAQNLVELKNGKDGGKK